MAQKSIDKLTRLLFEESGVEYSVLVIGMSPAEVEELMGLSTGMVEDGEWSEMDIRRVHGGSYPILFIKYHGRLSRKKNPRKMKTWGERLSAKKRTFDYTPKYANETAWRGIKSFLLRILKAKGGQFITTPVNDNEGLNKFSIAPGAKGDHLCYIMLALGPLPKIGERASS